MEYSCNLSGTCADRVDFELTDGVLHNIRFHRGCSGNTQGVARLAEGMTAEEYIRRCKGIRCGMKNTSCPDQFAKALEKVLAGQN